MIKNNNHEKRNARSASGVVPLVPADMVFIQGTDALFKVALTLIASHRALMLQCASFESIVDFLKVTLPEMVQVQMERIINQVILHVIT